MKYRRKGIVGIILVLVVIALFFGGYNIYRQPAMFRSLSDQSLSDPLYNGLL